MSDKILLVDDEVELLSILKRSLNRLGYAVETATSAEDAWQATAETEYDLVISDLSMGGMSGLELLRRIRMTDAILPFVIMTGAGTIDTAVEAIKLGAFHYITKPFKTQELVLLAQRAIEHGALQRKLRSFQAQEKKTSTNMVVGTNAVVQQIMSTIERVSGSDAPICIQGETGTGKSMLARHIHMMSARADKQFYTIDCGSLSENILESELFGHVKGAFTGATTAKRGLLEEAHGGTIFLDEIGELSPTTQVKLLRAIQEKEIKPVGGNSISKIDVRFISATSRNLDEGVESGEFRKDLYYRLAVIPLRLPALRERPEDLLLFIGQFVQKYNAQYNKNVVDIAPCALQVLTEMQWKGNLRELENAIERAVLLTSGTTISLDALCITVPTPSRVAMGGMASSEPVELKSAVEFAEITAIRNAITLAEGNRSKAARILGIGRRTLYDKIEAYGIE